MAFDDYRREVFSILGYEPSAEQWEIHRDQHRIKQVAGGERGGKSVVGAREVVLAAPFSRLIWLAGAEFDIPRTEFEYILNDLMKLHLISGAANDVSFPKQGQCSMQTFTGCKIVTKSCQDIQKLGMDAPDLILITESAQIEFDAYLRLRGRAAEKRAKLILTGTFEGSIGWYADYWNRWQAPNNEDAKSFSLPSWSNLKVYPLGRQDPEILRLEEQTPPDIFLERYAGVPCPPSGLMMKGFSNAIHVGEYSFDAELPVEVWVDPGYAGAHAVEVIQLKPDGVYVVDEIYKKDVITEDIINMCKARPWWDNCTGGVIDVAGRQHQATRAPVEIWKALAGKSMRSRKVHIEAGADTLQTYLHNQKIYFNYNCKGIIAECGGGRSPVYGGGAWLRDENTGKPLAKNDHACKSIIYGLVDHFGYSSGRRRHKIKILEY